jgi:hypothetical protein
MGKLLRHSAVLTLLFALSCFTHAQSPVSGLADAPPTSPSSSKASLEASEPRVGIGVKGSFLGGGAELAARVTHHTNVRAGFNMFTYSRDFNKDSIAYNGQLNFKTVEAHYDIYPFAGKFHLSPGALAYIGNPITATAAVPGGQSFSLGWHHVLQRHRHAGHGKWKDQFRPGGADGDLWLGETWFRATTATLALPSSWAWRSRVRPKRPSTWRAMCAILRESTAAVSRPIPRCRATSSRSRPR